MPEFYIIIARKITKFLNFYIIFPKMPEFFMTFAQKYFFLKLGGHVRRAPPVPVSYARPLCLCGTLLHDADMMLCHRAAALRSGHTTDVATDDESNNDNYIIYEYPGLASVRIILSHAVI